MAVDGAAAFTMHFLRSGSVSKQLLDAARPLPVFVSEVLVGDSP